MQDITKAHVCMSINRSVLKGLSVNTKVFLMLHMGKINQRSPLNDAFKFLQNENLHTSYDMAWQDWHVCEASIDFTLLQIWAAFSNSSMRFNCCCLLPSNMHTTGHVCWSVLTNHDQKEAVKLGKSGQGGPFGGITLSLPLPQQVLLAGNLIGAISQQW